MISSVAIGCDHTAVAMKEQVAKELRGAGLAVEDVGTFGDQAVDYPDPAAAVAGLVATGSAQRGILFCGSGIGVSIAANKIRGIRASLCTDVTTASLARRHNDANVLCVGARTLGPATVLEIVRTWIATEFEGGRHSRRVEKISMLEECADPTDVFRAHVTDKEQHP